MPTLILPSLPSNYEDLLLPVTPQEIKNAVLNLQPLKALGPDGLPLYSSKSFGTMLNILLFHLYRVSLIQEPSQNS